MAKGTKSGELRRMAKKRSTVIVTVALLGTKNVVQTVARHPPSPVIRFGYNQFKNEREQVFRGLSAKTNRYGPERHILVVVTSCELLQLPEYTVDSRQISTGGCSWLGKDCLYVRVVCVLL